MSGRTLALGALLLLALSGCSGSDGGEGAAGPRQCEECVGGAVVEVTVVDDSGLPISGATVGLAELGAEQSTDDGGRARFEGIPAGTYTVHVVRLGFDAAASRVVVAEEEVVSVQVQMTAIRVAEPYHDVIGPMDGYFSCGVGTPTRIAMCNTTVPGAFPDDKLLLEFSIGSDAWETFVGEMRWTQGTYATSTHLGNYMSYVGREGTHWWCDADGQSPIVFRYERTLDSVCVTQGDTDPQPHGEMTLFVAADTGFGGLSADNPPLRVALQQRYTLLMTVFYEEPGPAGWTAFPDT